MEQYHIDIIQLVNKQYHTLSKRQQKVAKYLLEEPRAFAMKSAMEIGKEIGVSESTVIRFCYSLHLNGFSELQKIVREHLIFQKSNLDHYSSNKPHFYAEIMEQDCVNIQRTIQSINEDTIQMVVEKLNEAHKVIIIGKLSSYAAAHWLSFSLGLIRDNVFLFKSDTDDLVSTLEQMNEHTVLIAISFHRYLKETIKIAELAKKQHAFVIGITDSKVAPISKFSHLVLPISQSQINISTLDATPALFSLLKAIVTSLSMLDKERFEKRKQQYERIEADHFFEN